MELSSFIIHKRRQQIDTGQYLLGNGRRAAHVFIGRVGARADEPCLELGWPSMFLNRISEGRDGGCEVGGEGAVGHRATASSPEVLAHAVIVGEHRGGGADLRSHVADGGHAGAGDAVHARAKVLHNGPGATLDCEDAGNLANDVFGGGPLRHGAGELHTDDFGALELPGKAGHHVHSISTTDTDSTHAETTSIRGM
eukprot:scaffold156511_cov38-Prasinocladus_malaysianus.AAC.1